MIGSRQVPYKTPISTGAIDPNSAVFAQMYMPLFAGFVMPPWVIFEGTTLTKCRAHATAGTFTAHIFIDAEVTPSFIITDADTEVSLEVGKTGTLDPVSSVIRCTMIAATDVTGLNIVVSAV